MAVACERSIPQKGNDMILKELIESGLIKDEEIVCLHRPMYGTLQEIRSGNWFQDHILDLMDEKIDTLHYCCGNWDIHLEFRED